MKNKDRRPAWLKWGKSKKSSKNNKRFLSSIDMMEAKRLESISNSQFKRGEIQERGNVYICGCGREGCLFNPNLNKGTYTNWMK